MGTSGGHFGSLGVNFGDLGLPTLGFSPTLGAEPVFLRFWVDFESLWGIPFGSLSSPLGHTFEIGGVKMSDWDRDVFC